MCEPSNLNLCDVGIGLVSLPGVPALFLVGPLFFIFPDSLSFGSLGEIPVLLIVCAMFSYFAAGAFTGVLLDRKAQRSIGNSMKTKIALASEEISLVSPYKKPLIISGFLTGVISILALTQEALLVGNLGILVGVFLFSFGVVYHVPEQYSAQGSFVHRIWYSPLIRSFIFACLLFVLIFSIFSVYLEMFF